MRNLPLRRSANEYMRAAISGASAKPIAANSGATMDLKPVVTMIAGCARDF